MYKVKDYYNFIDTWAPFNHIEEGDNVGLLCGDMQCAVTGVMIALDVTLEVIKEAKQKGANLIISHHPIIFGGIYEITLGTATGTICYALAQNSMNVICAHTNLDAAKGGVNDVLAEAIGLSDVVGIEDNMLMRVGELPQAMDINAFAQHVKESIGTTFIRISGKKPEMIKKVALIGGSGGTDIMQAKNAGADIFLVGDGKHHEGLAAKTMDFCMMEAGHYETEVIILEKVHSYLQTCTNEVQSINGIHVTCTHTNPFEVVC